MWSRCSCWSAHKLCCSRCCKICISQHSFAFSLTFLSLFTFATTRAPRSLGSDQHAPPSLLAPLPRFAFCKRRSVPLSVSFLDFFFSPTLIHSSNCSNFRMALCSAHACNGRTLDLDHKLRRSRGAIKCRSREPSLNRARNHVRAGWLKTIENARVAAAQADRAPPPARATDRGQLSTAAAVRVTALHL